MKTKILGMLEGTGDERDALHVLMPRVSDAWGGNEVFAWRREEER